MMQATWQDALNIRLIQRLLQPMVTPGVIPDDVSKRIFSRSQQLINRLSLLQQFEKRWSAISPQQGEEMPLIYAQWSTPPQPPTSDGSIMSADSISTVSPNSSISSTLSPTISVVERELVSLPIVQVSKTTSQEVQLQSDQSQSTQTKVVQSHEILSTSMFETTSITMPLSILTSDQALPIIFSSIAKPWSHTVNNVPSSFHLFLPLVDSAESLDLQTMIPPEKKDDKFTLVSFPDNNSVSSALVLPNRQPSPVQRPIIVKAMPSEPANPSNTQGSHFFAQLRRRPSSTNSVVVKPALQTSTAMLSRRHPLPLAFGLSNSPHPSKTKHSLVAQSMSSQTSSAHTEASSFTSTSKDSHPSTMTPLRRSAVSPMMSAPPITPTPLERAGHNLSHSDLNRLTQQVEHKLMRRLVVEKERRGKSSWH